MLLHQHYFQHNIIEAGAHYADFPWRPANNINNTGFPEPVPYAGDKRIFMAEQFYDETHPVRRPLHRAYIRKCLENFRHYPNVIHTIGEEFTGPLHFVQFWIDMIKEWELETGIHPLIALSTTKDVQDAILADPERAGVIDIIDIRYWHYQADGTLYAPQGGQNLAPRQHARLLKPKSTSLQQVYRAISEYRQKYPGKAVIYSADGADRNGWAVLMAGGSLPNIRSIDGNFLSAIAAMQPLVTDSSSNQWVLHGKSGYVIYNNTETMHVPAGRPGTYKVNWINAATGDVYAGNDVKIKARNPTAIRKPFSNAVLWLIKNQ